MSVPLLIFLAAALVWHIMRRRTQHGFSVFMVGSNIRASEYSGLPTKRTLALIYTFSGLICAVAGILMALGLMAVIGPGESSIVLALGIAYTPAMARVVRSIVMSLRGRDFVEASMVTGNSTLYTMAAVQAFAQAAEQAGSTDWEAVSAALKSGSFQTVLGEISFDEKGDVSAPGFVVYAWHQGEYDYVQE